jgi:hypothetical protein
MNLGPVGSGCVQCGAAAHDGPCFPRDVTAQVQFRNPDDELLPVTRCVCGCTFAPWKETLGIYPDQAQPMPCCGRRLYFTQRVQVWETHNAD